MPYPTHHYPWGHYSFDYNLSCSLNGYSTTRVYLCHWHWDILITKATCQNYLALPSTIFFFGKGDQIENFIARRPKEPHTPRWKPQVPMRSQQPHRSQASVSPYKQTHKCKSEAESDQSLNAWLCRCWVRVPKWWNVDITVPLWTSWHNLNNQCTWPAYTEGLDNRFLTSYCLSHKPTWFEK